MTKSPSIALATCLLLAGIPRLALAQAETCPGQDLPEVGAWVSGGAELLTVAGSTADALDDLDESAQIACWSGNGAAEEVVSFTPTEDLYLQVDLAGSSYDTKLALVSPCPSGVVACIYSDDYLGMAAGFSCSSFEAGVTYSLVISGYAGATGAYVLNVRQCTLCGNDLLEPGEQCDDGNTEDGDGCSSTCQLEIVPGCGNGIWEPVDGEQCDWGPLNGLLPCGCRADCSETPDNTPCDDGRFCTGADVCTPRSGWKGCDGSGTGPCDDLVDCTHDTCNELLDTCRHEVDDSLCDDGDPCNGVETCDLALGCRPGAPLADGAPCDDGLFCNGADTCAAGACAHAGDPCAGGAGCQEETASCAALVINEVDYDQAGTDAAEFVELFNAGAAAIDLDGFSLVLVNGDGAVAYAAIDLPAFSLAAGEFFVVCANAATVPNCDLAAGPDTNFLQNGSPDAVALLHGPAIVDALSYEGDTLGYTEGGSPLEEDLDEADLVGLARYPDGRDSNDNRRDFSRRCITPGLPNSARTEGCRCGNGAQEPGEECDDGNQVAGDGCTGCLADFCGDGVVNNAGLEQCDDGNQVAGDGCVGCLEEPGWYCEGSPGGCTPRPALLACPDPIDGPYGRLLTPWFVESDDAALLISDVSAVFPDGIPLPGPERGGVYPWMWININGNVSFEGPNLTYTPTLLPVDYPIIAAYFGDVDLGGTGDVWYCEDVVNRRLVVTYDQVGYYRDRTDRLNTFQLVLENPGEACGPGGDSGLRIRFIYHTLEWTTGDASGGVGGLCPPPFVPPWNGGAGECYPAAAGYDVGDGIYSLSTPGSGYPEVLGLVGRSNAGVPGVWQYLLVDTCGDGVTGACEECDDGNAVDDDGCTNLCTLAACGDGHVDPATEDCDGVNLGAYAGLGCAEYQPGIFTGGSLSCAADCTLDLSGCEGSYQLCYSDEDGDGSTGTPQVIPSADACGSHDTAGRPWTSVDDGDCLDDPLDPCATASLPGGIESCDGCDNDCDGGVDDPDDIAAGYPAITGASAFHADADLDGCGAPGVVILACAAGPGLVDNALDPDDGDGRCCGNGQIEPGEGCDDGANGDPCDGCLDDCTAYVNACGDGVQCGAESCDDGANGDPCDGCLDDCTAYLNACGDGVRCGSEECDDGNQLDGDGCSATCTSEGQPACGNALHEAGEECDDGRNGDPCDGCLDDCTAYVNVCGDGVRCGAEACDDGANGDPCDGCLDDCSTHQNVCGDGFQCGGEECDDGNTADGDGCSVLCEKEGGEQGSSGCGCSALGGHPAPDLSVLVGLLALRIIRRRTPRAPRRATP